MDKHGNFSLGIEIPQQLSNDAYHHSDRASEHVSPGLVTLLPAPCGTQNQGQAPPVAWRSICAQQIPVG